MLHFSIKITQGGRYIEYSAIARNSAQEMKDAFSLLNGDEPFAIMVSGSKKPHG